MKIEQILEGRAEEIDSQIAALRREKAALGRPNTPPPGTQVAALPNTPPPGTQPGTGGTTGGGNPAVDDFSDMPGRQVAAGTGADGPAGQYATPTPEVDDFRSMTAAEKATAYRNKMHAIPDKQSQQILNTEKSKRQSAQALAYDRAQSKERSDRIVNTEKSKRQTAQSGAFDKLMKNAGVKNMAPLTGKSIHIGDGNRRERLLPAVARPIHIGDGNRRERLLPAVASARDGTAKKGDDNSRWYNKPGTKMTPDAAKYADETGESPEIQKRDRGNLLKWMKANATKRKAFDQDAANK